MKERKCGLVVYGDDCGRILLFHTKRTIIIITFQNKTEQ